MVNVSSIESATTAAENHRLDSIIEIEGLVHRYGDAEVLHGIDLAVGTGEGENTDGELGASVDLSVGPAPSLGG